MKLTRRLEEYLEAIFIIGRRKGAVRVKDLVERLGVRASSVVEALRALGRKGLVVHERYGYVKLTSKGERKAKEVYRKHGIIKEFFEHVLKLPPGIAEKDACVMEHYISKETLERLLRFIEFIRECPDEEPFWLSGFQYYLETKKRPNLCSRKDEFLRLSEINPEEVVRVVRIEDRELRRRLGNLGVLPGVDIKVLGRGPFGDPIEVEVKGTRIALRNQEAEHIIVEKEGR